MMPQYEIETKAGVETATVFIDRFYVRVNGSLTKLVFSELVAGAGDIPRSAIMLSTDNAVAFAELLLDLVRKNREAKAQTATPTSTSASDV